MSGSARISILLLLLITADASASEREEILRCASESSDLVRLICYDNLARSLQFDAPRAQEMPEAERALLSTQAAVAPATSRRRPVEEEVPSWALDQLVLADGREQLRLSYRSRRPRGLESFISLEALPDARLMITCGSGQSSVRIDWDRYLGRGFGTLSFELDGVGWLQTAAEIEALDPELRRGRNQVTVLPNPEAFIRGLGDAEELIARTRDEMDNTLVARFDLYEAAEALETVRRSCQLQ